MFLPQPPCPLFGVWEEPVGGASTWPCTDYALSGTGGWKHDYEWRVDGVRFAPVLCRSLKLEDWTG